MDLVCDDDDDEPGCGLTPVKQRTRTYRKYFSDSEVTTLRRYTNLFIIIIIIKRTKITYARVVRRYVAYARVVGA